MYNAPGEKELESLQATDPCSECAYLIAAGPSTERHADLVVIGPEHAKKGVYRCKKCRWRWMLGSLGWSRLT